MPPRQSKTCCSSLLTCVSRSELLLVLLSPPHRQSESPSASFFCSLRLNKYVQCLSLFTCILQSVSLSFLLSPPLRQSKPCCQLFSHSYLPAATPVFVVICVTQTSNITWYLTLLPSPPQKKNASRTMLIERFSTPALVKLLHYYWFFKSLTLACLKVKKSQWSGGSVFDDVFCCHSVCVV